MQEDIESEPLYLNPVLEPLVMCLARGLFRDFETADEIFALEPSKGECYELALSTSEEQQTPKRHASFCSAGDYPQSQTAFLLNVNPCARPAGRTPFFEKMSGSGPTGQILGATWLNDELGRLGRRAGYDRKISIHDLRAEALVRADENGYSIDERMKLAGHATHQEFFDSYMSSACSVQGVGNILGLARRKDIGISFRGLSLCRHPRLWQALPVTALAQVSIT